MLFLSGGFLSVAANADSGVDRGDTAWLLISCALVLLMCLPGLALFYGGLVRRKNVLSVIADEQILPFNQFNTHLLGQERMLEVRTVARAGCEQNNGRIQNA